jgi:hypothetical protein
MNRVSRTEFPLQRHGNDLAYYKNGAWESYTGMLLTGRQVAISEAAADPRKRFLADDAVRDLEYGLKMRALQPGEQLVWSSPYRYDIEQRYGAAFMQSCGRFPDRQMGFLYRAYCADNGNVVLESQTVDHSDSHAFTAALRAVEQNPQADMDAMVDAYDDVLAKKHGGDFYAGRSDAQTKENVWNTMLDQGDLIGYFLYKLETIALNKTLQGAQLEEAVKRHVYGVWAAFKNRVDSATAMKVRVFDDGEMAMAQMALMASEVDDAFNDFVRNGRVMVGCGGAIEMLKGLEDILTAEPETVFEALMGKGGKVGQDEHGSLTFNCPHCHYQNRRRRGGWVYECQNQKCKGDVSCGRKK